MSRVECRPTRRRLHLAAVVSGLTLALSGPALAQAPPPPTGSPGEPPVASRTSPPRDAARCTITGTAGADVVRGTSKADVICGLGGNDRIRGLGGDDVLVGGAGRDVLDGGAGHDSAIDTESDRRISIEMRSPRAPSARIAQTSVHGPAHCYEYQSSTWMVQTGHSAGTSTGQPEWVQHYNGRGRYTANGWVVDTNSWTGPFWHHTDYPEWFYLDGRWSHSSQGGGESWANLGLGNGYFVGVQWVKWQTSGRVSYSFTRTDQEFYGVTTDRGHCATQ